MQWSRRSVSTPRIFVLKGNSKAHIFQTIFPHSGMLHERIQKTDCEIYIVLTMRWHKKSLLELRQASYSWCSRKAWICQFKFERNVYGSFYFSSIILLLCWVSTTQASPTTTSLDYMGCQTFWISYCNLLAFFHNHCVWKTSLLVFGWMQNI